MLLCGCHCRSLALLLQIVLAVNHIKPADSTCVYCSSVEWLPPGPAKCGAGYTPLHLLMCDGSGGTYFCDDVGPGYIPRFGKKLLQQDGIQQAMGVQAEQQQQLGLPATTTTTAAAGSDGAVAIGSSSSSSSVTADYITPNPNTSIIAAYDCMITHNFGTSSGYVCGYLCVKDVNKQVKPSPRPRRGSRYTPPNAVGKLCSSAPSRVLANINPASIGKCVSYQSGSYCWASCASGYAMDRSAGAPHAQCSQGKWKKWAGRCVLGAECAAAPSQVPNGVNATSVGGCVNYQSTNRCTAKCNAGYTASSPAPYTVCINGEWQLPWVGSCTKAKKSRSIKPPARKEPERPAEEELPTPSPSTGHQTSEWLLLL